MRIGKAALDKVLPPIITGSMAIVIGIGLGNAALGNAGNWASPETAAKTWTVAFITLIRNHHVLGLPAGQGLDRHAAHFARCDLWVPGCHSVRAGAVWQRRQRCLVCRSPFTFPAFDNPQAWGFALSIALIFIATVPESTAHLYQMSLYIDELAGELKRKPFNIKELIGLNLIADGSDDIVVGMIGGAAGTNYGENNSLMAITRNYSTAVLMTAAVMAIVMGFVGKLVALVNTMPAAVVGGLSIYLFGVIGMQGVALLQSEKVNLFDPKNLAIGAVILICGIGGNLSLPNGLFPFPVPYLFPTGIPAIVFAAILGIFLNAIFLIFKTPEVRGG